jgi:hypothetical protein
MKYSIIGNLNGILPDSTEEQEVIDKVNTYDPIWRFKPNTYENEEGLSIMTFEIWLETIENRDDCFADMKTFVDTHTGGTSWHECTHDKPTQQPCVIIEEYRR